MNAHGALPGNRNRSESMARVSKLYEESNGGDSAVAVGSLLERAEESDPGFSERVCAVLDSKAAVHDLTLRDVIGHIRLWHFEGQAVECGAGRLDGDMHRMARAVGKEWRRCTSCVRTAAAWWIAMTIECDLGLDRLARRVPKSGPGQPASPAERELARPRLATTLRVARLYQEFNHGSKMEPEELHDTVVDLLDTLKEYYPGFRERIADTLAAEDPGEAVLSLTLDDVICHNKMWHLIGLTEDDHLDSDRLWGDMQRMATAVGEECGACVPCARAAIAGWIARTVAWELGPRTTPDPLMAPNSDSDAGSGGQAAS